MQAFIQTAPTRSFTNPNTSSSRQAVDNLSSPMAVIRVFNDTTGVVWVEEGQSTVTATVGNSVPVPPGYVEVLRTPFPSTHVAIVAASALTGTVYVTPGDGL